MYIYTQTHFTLNLLKENNCKSVFFFSFPAKLLQFNSRTIFLIAAHM